MFVCLFVFKKLYTTYTIVCVCRWGVCVCVKFWIFFVCFNLFLLLLLLLLFFVFVSVHCLWTWYTLLLDYFFETSLIGCSQRAEVINTEFAHVMYSNIHYGLQGSPPQSFRWVGAFPHWGQSQMGGTRIRDGVRWGGTWKNCLLMPKMHPTTKSEQILVF